MTCRSWCWCWCLGTGCQVRVHAQGVPIRLELGPKDMEKEACVLVRRDTGKKDVVPWDGLTAHVSDLLEDIQVC